MTFSFSHARSNDPAILLPDIGLGIMVRLPSEASGGTLTIIETVNAPGFGPPLHRHRETEVFRVLSGRYLYEMDGRRFFAEEQDVISVPGGTAHTFVNVSDTPSRQMILILPGLDAAAFFTELGSVMKGGIADRDALRQFGIRWQVEFLGPPLCKE